MSNQHPFRAAIPALPVDASRPLWSVMIPTYNCAAYLHQTLARVLAQDPGPERMQIAVIDDHSTQDDPAAVVAEVGQGRVEFYRQPQNVGHIENFATCLKRARGALIHLLHGDDYVLDGFYRKLETAFAQHAGIGAAFCRQIFMDEDGHWQALSPLEQRESGILGNALERLAVEQRIMTPSIMVRRSVYEAVGGFDSRLLCAEDWEMWVRIAARYPIWYEVEPLAVYRMHSSSNTGRHTRTGADTRYNCLAIDLFQPYLPNAIADRVARRAKETYALSALHMAHQLAALGDRTAAGAQVRAALQCSRSWRVLLAAAKLIVRGVAAQLRAITQQKVVGV